MSAQVYFDRIASADGVSADLINSHSEEIERLARINVSGALTANDGSLGPQFYLDPNQIPVWLYNTTAAATLTLTVSDDRTVWEVTGSASTAITLPNAAQVPPLGDTATAAYVVGVKNDATTATTIATVAAQTIDGAASPLTLAASSKRTVLLMSNGTNWLLLTDSAPGITVQQSDEGNSVANVTTIEVDVGAGLSTASESGNTVLISQTAASATKVGYVSTGTQQFAGGKEFINNTTFDVNAFLTCQSGATGNFDTGIPTAGVITWPAAGGVAGNVFTGIDSIWGGGALVLSTNSTVLQVRGDNGPTGPGHLHLFATAGNPYFSIKVGAAAELKGLYGTYGGMVFSGGLLTGGAFTVTLVSGTTAITGGTAGAILYDNGGTVNELVTGPGLLEVTGSPGSLSSPGAMLAMYLNNF